MIILWLMLLNTMLSLVYFRWRIKTDFSQALCELVICMALPVFGIIYLLIGNLIHKFFYITCSEDCYCHTKLANPKAGFGAIRKYVANVIPLSDVLYLDDVDNKRELLSNVIRQDTLTNNKMLFKAVRDSDREVSHYAASMLTSMIEDLENKLFCVEQQLQHEPNNHEYQMAYADTMSEYLKIYFLDPLTKEKYLQKYRQVLWSIVNSGVSKDKYYKSLFECEFSLGNYSDAERVCNKFLQEYPTTEGVYLLYIKLYQQLKNYRQMHLKLQELKQCQICLSPKALQIIRFWGGGSDNV